MKYGRQGNLMTYFFNYTIMLYYNHYLILRYQKNTVIHNTDFISVNIHTIKEKKNNLSIILSFQKYKMKKKSA